ncbi:hypothetical protein N1851_034871 [Merluccius polli]|uniref:Uncharacterized protein n=1 Tax=Merluccius polli TaxID=89951 RepID=A0AA47LZ48_MERPO|nr:hypothetical protein N1851_034871 [Merluccius polli]
MVVVRVWIQGKQGILGITTLKAACIACAEDFGVIATLDPKPMVGELERAPAATPTSAQSG